MLKLKKVLKIIIVTILVISPFLFTSSGYSENEYSNKLRLQQDTERLKARQQALQRKVFLEQYGLSSFLTTEEALAYLPTVSEIPTVESGRTMPRDRALQLIEEGKVSMAEREDGTKVVVLVSPIDMHLEHDIKVVGGVYTPDGITAVFTEAPEFDFGEVARIRDRYEQDQLGEHVTEAEGDLYIHVMAVQEFQGLYGERTSAEELIEIVKNRKDQRGMAALVALELRGAMFSIFGGRKVRRLIVKIERANAAAGDARRQASNMEAHNSSDYDYSDLEDEIDYYPREGDDAREGDFITREREGGVRYVYREKDIRKYKNKARKYENKASAALKELRNIVNPKEIPALTEALNHSDSRIQEAAAHALNRIHDSEPDVGHSEPVAKAYDIISTGRHDEAYKLVMEGLLGEDFVVNIEKAVGVLGALVAHYGADTARGRIIQGILDIASEHQEATDQNQMKRELRKTVAPTANLSNLKLTRVFFLDTDVINNASGFREALEQLQSNEGNIPVIVLTSMTEDDVRTALRDIDLTGARFGTLEYLGLEDFNLTLVMSSILGIDDLQCVPLTDTLAEIYDALKKAGDKV